MTVFCAAPDASEGVALRLSEYVSCEGRALGENGFQALAGGPLGTSLLSGLVTIFIALIGYRLILGHTPDMRDGIGWTVRLGIVLALVTSWPAFQTLIYRSAMVREALSMVGRDHTRGRNSPYRERQLYQRST